MMETHLRAGLIALLALGAVWDGAAAAATLIQNVHGYTLVGRRLQTFDALVFDRGKVVDVGRAAALHRSFPRAQSIDGGGGTLLPGLIDAHGHVIDLGFEAVQIQLVGTPSLAAAQERIRAYVQTHPDRSWVTAGTKSSGVLGASRWPASSMRSCPIGRRCYTGSTAMRCGRILRRYARPGSRLRRKTPSAAGSSAMPPANRVVCWSTKRWNSSIR
jgi:hypothetical protein